ncbi:HNH endonuclease [bacterium]|nr:HNH endonuclease [bacterium]
MKFWVGVTDNHWYRFLAERSPEEVNFWQPGGTPPFMGALSGMPFLFKLKQPYNHIAGVGFFVGYYKLPLNTTWEIFGEKNGNNDRDNFRQVLNQLRGKKGEINPEIGCTILNEPVFFPEDMWIKDPLGWSSNIVRGKYYDSTLGEGKVLWQMVLERLNILLSKRQNEAEQSSSPLYRRKIEVNQRLGQGAFRAMVTTAYGMRCAMTGESTLPVLEAAHIKAYSQNGPNEVSNGLLLRSDFHKLYDNGLITITPELNIVVSNRIKEKYFNGKAYYRIHGNKLANIPADSSNLPRADFLQWHNEHVFERL